MQVTPQNKNRLDIFHEIDVVVYVLLILRKEIVMQIFYQQLVIENMLHPGEY